MLHGVKMFGGMLVLRTITTAYVAAGETQTEVDPFVANLQALFATGRARPNRPNLFNMGAWLHRVLALRTHAGNPQSSIRVRPCRSLRRPKLRKASLDVDNAFPYIDARHADHDSCACQALALRIPGLLATEVH
jgi:hypothetical protein